MGNLQCRLVKFSNGVRRFEDNGGNWFKKYNGKKCVKIIRNIFGEILKAHSDGHGEPVAIFEHRTFTELKKDNDGTSFNLVFYRKQMGRTTPFGIPMVFQIEVAGSVYHMYCCEEGNRKVVRFKDLTLVKWPAVAHCCHGMELDKLQIVKVSLMHKDQQEMNEPDRKIDTVLPTHIVLQVQAFKKFLHVEGSAPTNVRENMTNIIFYQQYFDETYFKFESAWACGWFLCTEEANTLHMFALKKAEKRNDEMIAVCLDDKP